MQTLPVGRTLVVLAPGEQHARVRLKKRLERVLKDGHPQTGLGTSRGSTVESEVPSHGLGGLGFRGLGLRV